MERRRLFAEMSKKPEEERKGGAKKDAGNDGKIKGCVFSTVDDVAGEAAEAQGEFSAEVEESADTDEECAEY
jgi:hypothetical protein